MAEGCECIISYTDTAQHSEVAKNMQAKGAVCGGGGGERGGGGARAGGGSGDGRGGGEWGGGGGGVEETGTRPERSDRG